MTIYRKPWDSLDDCDCGTFSYLIDWEGCSEDLKRMLIAEFRLVDKIVVPDRPVGLVVRKPGEYYTMGYQPLSEPQRLANRNCDRLQGNWMALFCAIFIPLWLIGFPIFLAPTDMPLVASIFTAVLATPLVGIGCGLAGNVIGFFHDLGQTAKYNVDKEKFDEQQKFENWIKGCRK